MPGEGKMKAKRAQLAKTGRTETFQTAQKMVRSVRERKRLSAGLY